MYRRPPRSTLFPSPTLFRSHRRIELTRKLIDPQAASTQRVCTFGRTNVERVLSLVMLGDLVSVYLAALRGVRSEEHTSELQSRQYLVCRLLLEKKKKR